MIRKDRPYGSIGQTALSILMHIMSNTKKGLGTGVRELAAAFGIQVYAAHGHLKRLEKRGLIRLGPKLQRNSVLATCTVYFDCFTPEFPNAKTQRPAQEVPSNTTTK